VNHRNLRSLWNRAPASASAGICKCQHQKNGELRIREFISVTSELDWGCNKSLAEKVRAGVEREHIQDR